MCGSKIALQTSHTADHPTQQFIDQVGKEEIGVELVQQLLYKYCANIRRGRP